MMFMHLSLKWTAERQDSHLPKRHSSIANILNSYGDFHEFYYNYSTKENNESLEYKLPKGNLDKTFHLFCYFPLYVCLVF